MMYKKQRDWKVACPVCRAKVGNECTSINTGCSLNQGHAERIRFHNSENLPEQFVRGAFFAFNEVLNWINTQTEQVIDKSKLYAGVMEMRPRSLASKTSEISGGVGGQRG